MKRYLTDSIVQGIGNKVVLLTGPRQCGKTTLARMLVPDYQYLSDDLAELRLLMAEKSWDRSKPLVIFDELHKMQHRKRSLKGIYDVEGIPPGLVVTGSANLSAFRKTGDSLAGRHFQFRLHPLDMKEALAFIGMGKDEVFQRLITVGGFPEPFLNGSSSWYKRWKRSHIDLILKEDLLTLTAVRDIQSVETLIEMLRSRVGSAVSVNALAVDLQKSPTTIQNWLKLLEDLYVVFRINPYHRNIARAILKEPKYYFYDNGMVLGVNGIKLENVVACALLKEAYRTIDVESEELGLHYIRNKEGYEIDFLITRDTQPEQMIDVKWQDDNLSQNFKKFLPKKTLMCT